MTGALGPPDPVPDPNRALDRFESAVGCALADRRFAAVYLGPWWNLEVRTAAPEIQGWKRSVLERQPGAGALHWGHFFLVWVPPDAGVDVRAEDRADRSNESQDGPPLVRCRLELGARDLWLIARSRSRETADRLAGLAHRVAASYGSAGPRE